MANYDPFEPEDDFNPLNPNNNYDFDPFDMGSKQLAANIGLINLSQSPITLNLRKQKPK